MDRRRFLQLVTGAGVTTATMAEAGFFAEFWKWVTKRPTWFIPKGPKPENLDPFMTYDPLAIRAGEVSADALLPELAGLQQLATIYYDRKAVDLLKRSMPLRAFSQQQVINHILRNGYGTVKVDWKR
jgi:hypothetical protein